MIGLLVALLCVVANGFFVAAEFALAKVRPTQLEALANQGDRAARRALGQSRQLQAYLSASQVGITVASLALGWIGEPAIAVLIEPPLSAVGVPPRAVHGVSLALALATISFLHIVIGEQVPKALALVKPVEVSRASSWTLMAFFYAMWPFTKFLDLSSRVFLRLLRLPAPEHAEGELSLEELRLLIAASAEGGSIEEQEREVIERVLAGLRKTARGIMVPRVDVVVLSLKDDWETTLANVRKHGYSRYPISESGEPDHIVGYVYVKDLMMAPRAAQGLRGMKRDILYVPAQMRVGDLLAEFQRSQIPIAVVVDEYGGASGLVTVEDAIEEVVGEIQDEHDMELPRMVERDDGVLIVDGSVPMGELPVDRMSIHVDLGSKTIGGFVVESLGRLARPGDVVRFGAFDAVVEDVRQRRVARVALHPRTASLPPDSPDGGHGDGADDDSEA